MKKKGVCCLLRRIQGMLYLLLLFLFAWRALRVDLRACACACVACLMCFVCARLAEGAVVVLANRGGGDVSGSEGKKRVQL